MRIVSLLPAATDIVAELGRLEELVGRTHECDWPPEVSAVPVVTGSDVDARWSSREISDMVGAGTHRGSSLYTVDVQRFAALAPELVLTQDLCHACAVSYRRVSDVARMVDTGMRVLSLEPRTLAGVLDCVRLVGHTLGIADQAAARVTALEHRLTAVRDSVAGRPRRTVVALEWLDPLWPAGHWVPEQIAAAGGVSPLATAGAHTSPMPWSAVVDARPEVLVVQPCGFAPERARAELHLLTALPGWSDLPAVAAGEVWLVDGPAYFNRPGPRVVRGAEVLAYVLHGVQPQDAPVIRHEAVRLTS